MKKIIETEEILKTDFGSRNCTSAEKKPLVSNFKEVEHKGQNTVHFNVLDSLL